MRLASAFKPWYVYRPGQLVRRAVRAVRPPTNPVQTIPLPWGGTIEADVREVIGRSLWTAGVYDLAVTELLYRLTEPGSLALDVGANIGVMTSVLASRGAEVWAFEPMPAIHRRLTRNVAQLDGLPGFGACRVFAAAVSDADGEAALECPAGFDGNNGIARLSAGAGTLTVPTVRLDGLLGDRTVGVMKIDVEGHELAALRGAEAALTAGRVRHLVFEDHDGPDSRVCRFLAGLGYTVQRVGWRMTGPELALAAPARPTEAPNYLATRAPDEALARCRPRGWRCLTRSAG